MKYNWEQLISSSIQFIDGDRGKNYPNGNDFSDKGYCLFLNAKNVTSDGFALNETMFITKEKDELLRKGKLERYDTVLTTRGTVGNVGFYDDSIPYDNVRINSGMVIIKADKTKYDAKYIYWLFRSSIIQNQIRMYQSGTAQPQLPISTIQKMIIPIISLDVQKKIAIIIGTIQEKIDLNRKINNNLFEQARALYNAMFVVSTSPNWRDGVLSDIADITMGQSPSGESYNEDGIGTVFYQGRAEFGDRFPTQRLFTTEPKRMAKENDVLMSVRAPVGDLNVAREDCCIGRGLASIRSKYNQQSFVLYTVFNLQPQLNMFNGEGTVFGSINRDSLNKMAIIIPDNESIAHFEDVVAPMDAQIRCNHEENLRLASIRDTLLPRLMSGELDVSEVEI